MAEIAALTPFSPFNTAVYAAARAALGERIVAFVAGTPGNPPVSGALAYLRSRRWFTELDLPTLPSVDAGSSFWTALRTLCRRRRVVEAKLESFASLQTCIPSSSDISPRRRIEFILHLDGSPLTLSENHRRSMRKAEAAGVTYLRTTALEPADVHLRLVSASLARRRARGERAPAPRNASFAKAVLASGAAELFQAVMDDDVLSSVLLLRGPSVRYYHSAGNTELGRQLGASPYLISAMAGTLAAEGVTQLNLGGASSDNPGLLRFKRGFGAREVPLESGVLVPLPGWLRKVRTSLRLLRDDPSGLMRAIIRRESLLVYSAVPCTVPAATLGPDCELRTMTDDALEQLARWPEWGEQAERFHTLGFNAAFGLYVHGELVHVAWLIGADQHARRPVRHVRLRDGEYEITHCYTATRHRGRQYYPAVIRGLCAVAARRGASRVFMVTSAANVASQKGIERAGLARAGRIQRLYSPQAPQWISITFRASRPW